jgi:ABC-2 type transport system permease protein
MITGISQFISSTAFASFVAFTILVILVSVIVYSMTKNYILTGIFAVVVEGIIAGLYFYKATLFAGLIGKILGVIDLATRFENFVNGIFDITGIVYYLSIIVIFIFLTVQSLQKRRWS